MRGCPDRMGELERRLRRDGIELARSKGGAMATAGSHRVKPFGGRGRRERRRTKRDPGERCQGAAARAKPCVTGSRP